MTERVEETTNGTGPRTDADWSSAMNAASKLARMALGFAERDECAVQQAVDEHDDAMIRLRHRISCDDSILLRPEDEAAAVEAMQVARDLLDIAATSEDGVDAGDCEHVRKLLLDAMRIVRPALRASAGGANG